MNGAEAAVLALLTHAGDALQEARELALAANLDVTEQVARRAMVFVASAIDTVTQPLSCAGVMQPPKRPASPDRPGSPPSERRA